LIITIEWNTFIATFFLVKTTYTINKGVQDRIMGTRAGWYMAGTCCLALLILVSGVLAITDITSVSIDPLVYLNFNEGSGIYALDASGHGSTGTIHGATRIENGGCGRALLFNGIDNYVEIPFSSNNHPKNAITVSCWFYVNSYDPQVLISSYHEGGYRLAFADGRDLWWTVNLDNAGDVSLPIRHDGISLKTWHYLTGSYDGTTSKVYLDGILLNQQNMTGTIHYSSNNYVMLGADAGDATKPSPDCPQYLSGGLDEVRIYNRALTYGEVLDDKFHCPTEPGLPDKTARSVATSETCMPLSGTMTLDSGQQETQDVRFMNITDEAVWQVHVPEGSTLTVSATDAYSQNLPDAWYVEIAEGNQKIARTVAFPNVYNSPSRGLVLTGNATVRVHYFDGPGRFPAQVNLQFESSVIQTPPLVSQTILENPIIVIYSASWATLIAIIVVIIWLHKRRKNRFVESETQKEEKL
jgi:Concanavalin A-like lectin/glucanases superfamily